MYRNNRGGDGWVKGHWSPSTETAITGHLATPGRLERKAAVIIDPTKVAYKPFVINEFGIGDSAGEDWVELRNVETTEQSVNNLLLTSVTGLNDEKVVLHLHGKDYKVPAGGVVLITGSDPRDTDIAAGVNLGIAAADRDPTGIQSLYIVLPAFELPTGKFNLILRSGYNNKPDDFLGKALGNVIDAIGSLKVDHDTADFNTDFWPLNGGGAPHGKVINDATADFAASTVYERKTVPGGTGQNHIGTRGWTGLGYDRGALANNENGGTPGYPNGAIADKDSALTGGANVTISEIMYDRGDRENLPQWIELHNSSHTNAVSLAGWKLMIENDTDVNVRTPSVTIADLGGTIIQPNQTILIVAYKTGRVSRYQGRVDFPDNRIISLSGKGELEIPAGVSNRNYRLLSKTAFKITLIEKDGTAANPVDTAGNYGADPAWELPMATNGIGRSSILRRYNTGSATGPSGLRGGGKGTAQDGTLPVWSGKGTIAGQGLMSGPGEAGWILASETDFSEVRVSQTYYGASSDMGTPGYHGGGPLPVSLSKFRPERLDSGEIVIRWITESELNNAGFNILRSDKRDGQFTKINTSLIAGQGTTSERTTYEWKDTTAKPNVVYYYQIQDVSLDGKVQTLRQSRLKGNVTAAGKLTTTWGELKALQ